jgi:hypothetical protein
VGVPGERTPRLGLEGWFGTFSSPQVNSGAARVYLLEAGAWYRQSVLKIAPWPMNYAVPPLNQYGSSVTIGAGGQHVAVGAPYDVSPTGGVHLTPPNVTSGAFQAGAAFIWLQVTHHPGTSSVFSSAACSDARPRGRRCAGCRRG